MSAQPRSPSTNPEQRQSQGYLQRVTAANLLCYQNLSQPYEAEFSNLTMKHPNKNGLYDFTPVDKFHDGYIYYLDENRPIGFIVVNTSAPRLDITEFYVIPTERRHHYGKAMAVAIFSAFPGPWQLRQIMGADRAYRFWISVLQELVGDKYEDALGPDPEFGTVHIQKFEFRPSAKRAIDEVPRLIA